MMKSWKKQIFYFVMIAGFLVIIAALIAGCTSTVGNTGISGKYINKTQNVEQYIELHQDGTFYKHNDYSNSNDEGTYKVVGNIVRACFSFGSCSEFTIDGNALVSKNKIRLVKE